MKESISKELLTEVLEYEIKDFIIKDNLLKYDPNYSLDMSNNHKILTYRKSINIYELSHKCKEWAKSNLFSYMNIGTISETRACLDLRTKFNFGIWRGYSCSIVTLDERHEVLYTTKCFDTEPEAIFQACQWLIDNKDKQ